MVSNMACLFSQDFIEGLTWETGVSQRGMAVGVGGGFGHPPPPDEAVHVSTPFHLHGRCEKALSKACLNYIYWTWALLRAVLQPGLGLGGRGYLAGPPPTDWGVHSC